jgi:sulfoxide reductase heme-binding subunit YedZ
VSIDNTILDVCSYVGLAAVGAITLNMLLGMLMAFRYSPVRQWPHRRLNYFRLHNWTGYLALSVSILHPVVLLFDRPSRFRIIDLLYPVHSPIQPLENTIGAVALYFLAVVVATSYFRVQLGRRIWKSFHFGIYAAGAALFWHSLFTDPALKNSAIDWFDGGKLFVEACLAIIAVIGALRWRYAVRKVHRP